LTGAPCHIHGGNLRQRKSGTAHLEEAAAYRAALTERTRERAPYKWVRTQYNLGSTLWKLGQRKKDAAMMCEAVGIYLIAWEGFVMESFDNARWAVTSAEKTLVELKKTFESSVYEACLAQHAKELKRIGLP
jgi:hypothetical protein